MYILYELIILIDQYHPACLFQKPTWPEALFEKLRPFTIHATSGLRASFSNHQRLSSPKPMAISLKIIINQPSNQP